MLSDQADFGAQRRNLQIAQIDSVHRDATLLNIVKARNLEIGKGQWSPRCVDERGGKSTLADLIPRFYDVQKGRVAVTESICAI